MLVNFRIFGWAEVWKGLKWMHGQVTKWTHLCLRSEKWENGLIKEWMSEKCENS